jgi:hypothetical protein
MADLGNIGLRFLMDAGPVRLATDWQVLTNPSALVATYAGQEPLRLLQVKDAVNQRNGTIRPQFTFTTRIDGVNTPCWVRAQFGGRNGYTLGRSLQPTEIRGWKATTELSFVVQGDLNEQRRTESWGPYTISAHIPLSLTGSFPAGQVSVAYLNSLTAAGIAGGATWTVSGELPDGLTFDDGVLSGTPTLAGTFKFTTTLIDTYDNAVRYLDHIIVIAP